MANHKHEAARLEELYHRDRVLNFIRSYLAFRNIRVTNARTTDTGISAVLVGDKSEHAFDLDMKPLEKLDAGALALALISFVHESIAPKPEPVAASTEPEKAPGEPAPA